MTSVATPGLETAPTEHPRLLAWVQEMAELTTPDASTTPEPATGQFPAASKPTCWLKCLPL